MFKFILIVIIFFISSRYTNAQIAPSEVNEINKLLTIIGRSDNDICDALSCSNKGVDGYQHIVGILIFDPFGGDLSSVNFSVFSNLQVLDLGKKSYPPLNILSQLSKCNMLEQISIINLVEGVDTDLPSTLKTLQLNNFKGTFYAKWVGPNVSILDVLSSANFTLSGTFDFNEKLTSLDFPLPPNGFQNLSTCFPNLIALNFWLKEVSSYSGTGFVPSSYLGSIENLSSLTSLIFSFDPYSTSSSLKKLIYLPDLSSLKLSYFKIDGDAFVLADNKIFDLTSSNKVELSIVNSTNLFKNRSNCFKVPQDSTCEFSKSKIFIDQLDLRNCSLVRLNQIELEQQLLFNNLNFNSLYSLDISSSLFYGDLPDSLCLMSPYSLSIKNNLFASRVPSCYICTPDQDIRETILPNKFKNFNSTYPLSCENFRLDPIQELYLVDTQWGAIFITGNNLGYSMSVDGDVEMIQYPEYNRKIKITVPKGSGTSIKTLKLTLLDRDHTITIAYSYAAPKLLGYSVTIPLITIYGTNFDYNTSINKVYFDNNVVSTNALTDSSGVGYFILLQPLLPKDGLYNVYVNANGQVSNVIPLQYSDNSIVISDEEIQFTTDGGTLQLYGNFGSNPSLDKVSLQIGGLNCQVTQISTSNLTFVYPKTNQTYGSNILLALNINGIAAFKTVTIILFDSIYVPPPLPQWPSSSESSLSSSSSSSSPSSSSNQSSSSSSDQVSLSFKLDISFNLILIIILIISTLVY